MAVFLALPAVADDAGAPAGTRPVIEYLHPATPYDAGMTASGRPATPYEAGMTASGRPATTRQPGERDEPLRLMALVGPALAIGVLTVLGLTITFSALRQDMRRRRTVYRPRRH